MKYMATVLLMLLACASEKRSTRMDVRLKNTTPQAIVLNMKMGGFTQHIRLEPGELWVGWVDSRFIGKEAEITVEPREQK